jgi:hypothetical protein
MRTRILPLLLACLLLTSQALATWSIVVVNRRTGEVCVASATCIENFNLRNGIGVIAAEVGGGATQSLATSALTRREIHDLLLLGVPPQEILDTIAVGDSLWPARQIGIVDVAGRAVTYSGASCGPWFGGVVGEQGDYVYAIQGNVLTGSPVVLDCESAFRNTNGDLGQKVMAAMEAAMLMGGDGRCSCSNGDPEGCGVPPPNFTKSAHVAFFVIARPGEEEVCNNNGCAGGDFYLGINKASLTAADPDPVLVMRQDFDLWRAALAGRPDAMLSTTWPPEAAVAAGSAASVFFELDLADVNGVALQHGGATVTMQHDGKSAGRSSLVGVTDNGNGTYLVEIAPGSAPGMDLLRFIVDDGIHAVTLWPPARLLHQVAEPTPLAPGIAPPGLGGGAYADVRAIDLSSDGLTAWFVANDGNGQQLRKATRAGAGQPFGASTVEPLLNFDPRRLTGVRVSEDGLRAMFSAVDGPGHTSRLYTATRALVTDPFALQLAAILDSDAGETGLALSENELELVFASRRNGNWDLYRATRLSPEARFFEPVRLDALSTAEDELAPIFEQGDTRLNFSRYSLTNFAFTIHSAPRDAADAFPAAAPVAGVALPQALAEDVDPLDGALWSVSRAPGPNALLAHARPIDSLTADATSLSVSAGGSVNWSLDAGVAFGTQPYMLAAGFPGTESTPLGVILPFLRDAQLERIFEDPANAAFFPGRTGQLDAQGRAQAQWLLPAGTSVPAQWIGRSIVAAFVTQRGNARFVSQPRAILLEP